MRAALAAVLAALALAAAGCGGDDPGAASAPAPVTTTSRDQTKPGREQAFEGGLVAPVRAAPPLRLTDSAGRPFDLRELRGDPVLVTFVYASCPDVCPLIMQSLSRARELAGPVGARTRVVAVSVDPEGDTPEVVDAFLRRQRLRSSVRYLVGDRARLERVWSAWQVATRVPRSDPHLIEHTALIYGISAGGDLTTAYPIGFNPAAVARDLGRLARI